MKEEFERTCLIFGRENVEKLFSSRVLVFGLGGVGSYVVEALARSGVGAMDLVDNDRICLSNINRQLYALHSTVGKFKADLARERVLDINPDCKVLAFKTFFLPENSSLFDFSKYDYVVDCIDTVSAKIEIILKAKEAGVPVISCMGAGNKSDPTLFRVADISKTSVCPLARVMRRELFKRGIKDVKCLFSTEKTFCPKSDETVVTCTEDSCDQEKKKSFGKVAPGSNAFVPPVAGLIIAGEVVKDLMSGKAAGGVTGAEPL